MSQKPLSYETLASQVNALSDPTVDTGNNKSLYTEYMKPPYIFGLVPVVIGIVLFCVKPFFIMEQDPHHRQTRVQKYYLIKNY